MTILEKIQELRKAHRKWNINIDTVYVNVKDFVWVVKVVCKAYGYDNSTQRILISLEKFRFDGITLIKDRDVKEGNLQW